MLKTIPILALSMIPTLPACIIVLDHDDAEWVSGYIDGGSGGNLHAVREARELTAFHRIVVHDAIDVDVRIGEPQSVTVRASNQFASLVETNVESGELTVRWAERPSHKGSTMISPRLEIVVPSLDRVLFDGVGDLSVSKLNGGDLEVEMRGTGDVRADGKLDRLELKLSGIGDAEMSDLEARAADVTLAGTGDVEITVRDRLKAKATGVGDLRYRGHPKDVSKSASGVGSIEPDDLR